jgi:hypothetical protein
MHDFQGARPERVAITDDSGRPFGDKRGVRGSCPMRQANRCYGGNNVPERMLCTQNGTMLPSSCRDSLSSETS